MHDDPHHPASRRLPASIGSLRRGRSTHWARSAAGAVLLVFAAVTLAACGPREPASAGSRATGDGAGTGITIELAIDALEVGVVNATAAVTEAGEPVTGATVTLRGDMTHAGMAPSISALTEADPGHYATDAFQFQMAGDWIVTVDVTTADGRKTSTESFVTISAR